MTSDSSSPSTSAPAQHKPLVVGRTKPQPETNSSTSSPKTTMDSSSPADKGVPADVKAGLNHEIAENVKSNTVEAAPADPSSTATAAAGGGSNKKKEKAAKQPKQPKPAAAPAAPLSPALIDLRVGHILRAIAHPNADSLYVSTIAMGDPEGTDHTSVDEETGKVVRTVCSGLNGLVPLEEMQNRKVVVVANLKPVNMRSIKSAAMVLAASPAPEEGADPHAPDRVVELVNPPEGAEAGEPVFFEGWPYGEGRGPEKQLNPKKKQWEAIQPGFFTTDDLLVGFDASKTEIDGSEKGHLIVEGKGKCTVKTLKGAVVR
ncbi:G4 quadruplex nucleic acid binding protein [Knufia peltigerae]|nr:G4 quadruplex nucleic acid binding protein [Knufia peltigerae]